MMTKGVGQEGEGMEKCLGSGQGPDRAVDLVAAAAAAAAAVVVVVAVVFVNSARNNEEYYIR
jgi:hypothetical protein